MATVIYKGPDAPDDISSEFSIRDDDGEMHTLRAGVPAEVPDSLADEMLNGSPRTAGHEFVEGGDPDGYEHLTAAALKDQLAARGLPEPDEGTGANGSVVKADLVAALVADDTAKEA